MFSHSIISLGLSHSTSLVPSRQSTPFPPRHPSFLPAAPRPRSVPNPNQNISGNCQLTLFLPPAMNHPLAVSADISPTVVLSPRYSAHSPVPQSQVLAVVYLCFQPFPVSIVPPPPPLELSRCQPRCLTHRSKHVCSPSISKYSPRLCGEAL